MIGYSNNSCNDIAETSRVIFLDSKIAKDFKLVRTKKNIINHGIAPLSKMLYAWKCQEVFAACLSFDESLIEVGQDFKMIIMVQYWDDAKDQVTVGYHRSSFYGHFKTIKLIKELGNLTSVLDPVKLSNVYLWP